MNTWSFYFWTIWVISSALFVIISRNIMRSVVALLGMFLGIAAFFLLLNSAFLAMLVILILIGAVGILLLFSIMLMGESHITQKSSLGKNKKSAFFVASLFFVTSCTAILSFNFPNETIPLSNNDSIPQIGKLLLTDYLVHFEFISFILLIALIATVIIAKKD